MVFRPANKTFSTDKASLETLCTTILRFPFDQISNIKLNLIIQRNRERYESALFEKSSSNKKESNSYSKYCGGTAFQRELYTFKLTILYISSLSVSALLILFPLFAGRIVKRFLKIALLSWKQGRSVMKFRKEKLDKRLEGKRNDVNDRKGRIALNGGRVGLIEGGN